MAKKKTDDALTVSEAPEAVALAPRTVLLPFPGHFIGPDVAVSAVSLIGGGSLDGAYLVASPIPQELSHGTITYDLSDRAGGVYVHRHR